jgi:hypothetical protein
MRSEIIADIFLQGNLQFYHILAVASAVAILFGLLIISVFEAKR